MDLAALAVDRKAPVYVERENEDGTGCWTVVCVDIPDLVLFKGGSEEECTRWARERELPIEDGRW